jgi:putative transcriptional regulator
MAEQVKEVRDNLAPGFLAAMPNLLDPNFHRTVVLMLRHGDEGAFGLVINRPASVTAGEFCAEQEIPYGGPPNQPVMVGGPVQVDSHLLVLRGTESEDDEPGTHEIALTEGLAIVASREGLAHLFPASRVRCYLGYAGWGPGQLEDELAEGAWVPLPPDPRLVFDSDPAKVWQKALRSAGLDPLTLVPGGEVN